MTWHKIEERRPLDVNYSLADVGPTIYTYVEELEEAIGHLLETIGDLGNGKVERFWPEHEGWGATINQADSKKECCCPIPADCYCCEPTLISPVAADWIDPDGEKPEGWRSTDD